MKQILGWVPFPLFFKKDVSWVSLLWRGWWEVLFKLLLFNASRLLLQDDPLSSGEGLLFLAKELFDLSIEVKESFSPILDFSLSFELSLKNPVFGFRLLFWRRSYFCRVAICMSNVCLRLILGDMDLNFFKIFPLGYFLFELTLLLMYLLDLCFSGWINNSSRSKLATSTISLSEMAVCWILLLEYLWL